MKILLIAIMLTCLGCGSATTQSSVLRDATVSANATATTLETMQSLALVLYRTEQELAIAAAINNSEGLEQAKHRVQLVRDAWKPVWDAFEKARIAYDVLTKILSAVSPTTEAIQAAVTQQSVEMANVTQQLSIARSRVQKETP